MSKEKHGFIWTQKDENILEKMFYEGKSYQEMAEKLSRSWFSCKCRLIKLKLIPYSPEILDTSLRANVEKYDVPLNHANRKKAVQPQEQIYGVEPTMWVDEDTSRTFSNAELNIIQEYCKARLAKLAIQKLGVEDRQIQRDIAEAEDFFTTEIRKINVAKKMPIIQREKSLTRIA